MTSRVDPFRNPENFAKYLLFYFEPGCNVIIKTILWLTGGEEELKRRFNEANKKSFPEDETKRLKKYLDGDSKFNTFDLTFYFKICQIMCDLAPVLIKTPRLYDSKVHTGSNIIWTKLCPKHRQDELEYLLTKLKNGRNELAHPGVDHRNLTDLQVEGKCEEMNVLLTKILEKAGEKAENVSAIEIQTEVKEMQSHLERIKKDKNIDKSLEPHVRNLILKDLKKIYEKELESSFQNELRGYSIPYLKKQDEPENSRLSGIHFSSPVTVILGEAGAGKTSLTKFLFHSWLNGNTESLEELTEFDFVLRIQCNNIRSRDLNQFFEEHFLNAAFYFCNTSSLSRHFKDLKIFWIMDGFDESTPEFSGFLKSVTCSFPYLHKILITTRMHASQNLEEYFSETVSFNLEKLLDHNIEEILEYRINDDEQQESFKMKYNSLTMTQKTLLETPISFVMYIDLWGNSSSIEEGSISLTKLYTVSTKQKLTRLLENHQNKTQLLSEEDLHLAIENWFYGSLCKRSFLNVIAGKYLLDCDEIENLKIDATKGFLIPSACLSSFLESDLRSSSYNFKHSSQLVHFAALFMRKQPEDSSFELEGDYFIYNAKLDLINYFLEMISEDDAVNKSSEQIFGIIHKFVSSFKEFDQGFVWHETWISTYLMDYIKENISRELKSCFYVDMRTLWYPSLIELIEHIKPKKIVINTKISVLHHQKISGYIPYYISMFLECLHQFEYGKLQIELRPSLRKNQEQIIKSEITNRFKNAKHQLLYYEIVSSVIIQALRWLYVGQEPLEKHLVDLTAKDKSCLSSRDIYLLKELAEGNFTIEELDPDLLLKVARIIYEVDVRNNSSWRKLWGAFTHVEIKFSELISDFNSLPHHLIKENIDKDVYSDILTGCDHLTICQLMNEVVAHNISYTGVTNKEEEIKKLLKTILQTVMSYETSDVITGQLKNNLELYIEKMINDNMIESNFTIKKDFDFSLLKSILTGAGNGANLEFGVINESIDHFQQRLKDLYSKSNFDVISTIHVKNIIIKELLTQYENDKAYYEKEMERYIPATLLDGDKKIHLSDVSFEDCKVIFVRGDSGMGKSAMARYLFASWVSGVMDSLVWLKSFDIVFLLNGKINQCKFVTGLPEFLLPRSCNIFPTTNFLMKQLEKMRVLWICDGFDDPLSILFRHLAKRFFKSHKFLNTSRYYMSYEYHALMNSEFDISNSKLYNITLLDVENINIFLSKRISKSRSTTIRDSLRSRLDECDKFLYSPFYLSVYVELLQSETKGTLQLYSKCKLTETMLLINQTNLRLEQLKDSYGYSDSKVDKWFYGSLCRQSFIMIYNRKFPRHCIDLEKIESDAVKENLDTITCLNFFLVMDGAEGAKYGFNCALQPYVLASFYLKKWMDYPPFPENEVITSGSLETSAVWVLNSFIIMAIYEDLNETCAIKTASKVAYASHLEDEFLLWYNICGMNNFEENVMKFVANILDGFDCYVLSYKIQNISDIAKFFTFFTPKAIRFTSIYWNKDKFSKEAYVDLLNVLKEKPLDILMGPIDFRSKNSLPNRGGEFIGVKVLDLINDVASLNITFFEGIVEDLLLLGNYFGKLKKLDLRDISADSYHELCIILTNMAQLMEINLSFVNILSLKKIYPVNFITRTTLICLDPEIFTNFIKMIQSIKCETTSKFQRLIIKNWSRSQWCTPDGRYETHRDYVNDHFSEIEFAPETVALVDASSPS